MNQLFTTLDTTATAMKLPTGLRAVAVDTVGFVANLPHEVGYILHLHKQACQARLMHVFLSHDGA